MTGSSEGCELIKGIARSEKEANTLPYLKESDARTTKASTHYAFTVMHIVQSLQRIIITNYIG